jgi:pSer/pThr/pTyr-binding forkhead associated (FHA) protein
MVTCPNCGHSNAVGSHSCKKCQHIFADQLSTGLKTSSVSLESVKDLKYYAVRLILDRKGIVVQSDEESIAIPLGDKIYIGRNIVDGVFASYIDMAVYGGLRFGMSRIHAMIETTDHQFQLMDLGSTNGSTLDGERMEAFRSYPLRDNSEVVLGQFPILVQYYKPAMTS